MGKKILFSSVGGTDPISENNYRDGSMLHICRHYKPDKVILYLSKEMAEKHHKYNPYGYCIEKLAELQNRHIDVEYIERNELTKVQEYDYFYKDFRNILKGIMEDMDECDEFLLNISSGTPAMKSGLVVLKTLGEIPCRTIQVVTPSGKMNEHSHQVTDYAFLWELDEDNNPDSANRCIEVECPTLAIIKKEEIIKKHIEAYDYSAALQVAKTIKKSAMDKGYYSLIEMAKYRESLDYKKAFEISLKEKAYCFPVKDDKGIKLFEYALNIDVKRKRHEYADFIRSITPLFVDLFELVLKHETGIDINKYCRIVKKRKHSVRVWDLEKLNGSDVLNALNSKYERKGGLKEVTVSSDQLVELLKEFIPISKKELIDLISNLREVEETIRNTAAHEIVSVTDDVIKNKTNFSSNAIMRMIEKVFSYTDLDITDEYWNSYDLMNQLIIERID